MTLSSVNFTSQKISDSENKIENKHVDTTKATTHIGLCAGYGGIELGLKRIIPNLRSVALCEIEGFAVANLVAKMEAGLMESAPIWTDLKTFPWGAFRDRVDILTGGYSCQPFSAAGKRLGTEDPRHLWPFIAGGIRILRPKLCFFENVEGHISLGLREVVGELESMGYKVSWGIFSAREVGAPHQRKRVFIMAHLKCEGLERLDKWHTSSEQTELVGADSRSSCQRSAWEGYEELADIQSIGLEKQSECCIKSEASGSGIMHSSGIHSCIPTIPGELVDSSNGTDTTHRHAEEDRLPSKHWEEVCSREFGGANADTREDKLADTQLHGFSGRRTDCNGNGGGESSRFTESSSNNIWPSRPGESQHEWEPPRVVGGNMANSNSSEQSEGRGDDAEVSEVSSEQWTDECATLSGGEGEFSGEEVVGNAAAAGLQGCGTSSEMDDQSRGAEGEGSESTSSITLSSDARGREVVGNTILHGYAPTQIGGGTSQSEAKRWVQESEGGSPSVGNAKHDGLLTESLIRGYETTSDSWGTEEPKQAGQSSGADRPLDVPSLQGRTSRSESMANAESKQGTPRDHRGESGSLSQQEQVESGGGDCGALRENNGQVEPCVGLHFDESSSILGQTLTLNPYGDNVYKYENLSKKKRAREILFEVWTSSLSETIQWTTGGLQHFFAEKILQSGMQLDGFTQRICYFVWCVQTGYQAQGWGLSGMSVYESCGNTSQGQKPIEQFKRELGYAMCQLSYEIALERGQDSVEATGIMQGLRESSERAWSLSEALPEMEEVWKSSLDQKVWENGCFIEASSKGNRTDELRLLGNGVVPATAERAFRVLWSEINTIL